MIPPPLKEELLPREDVMPLLPLELPESPRPESELLPITLLLLPPERALRLLLLPPDRPLPPLSIQEERGQVCEGNVCNSNERPSNATIRVLFNGDKNCSD